MPNRFTKLLEDKLGVRIIPKPSKSSDMSIATHKDLGDTIRDLMEASCGVDISELDEFRTLSTDREAQYRVYDDMDMDSTISSVIEMYADDATQYNNKGQIIWAESDDADVAAFANRIIDVLQLNENAWSHIYALCKYGDLYLELFKDDESSGSEDDDMITTQTTGSAVIKSHRIGSYLEEYAEQVSNPAEIYDLTQKGKTVGFIKVKSDDNVAANDTIRGSYHYIDQGEETIIYPADKYVHICLAPNTERFPDKVRINYSAKDHETGQCDPTYTEYTVRRGKSILYDIYKTYKELNLLQDSVLMNRVTRSSIIRILQIEVGDMPKPQARETLKRVKQLIEQKNFMNKNDGTYSSTASPGPLDNIIYVPTHEGKGNISMSNIGGDVDVKSIADLEYYLSKLAGGLKVPIGYIQGSSGENGLAGGQALTKLDSRYARTIKRIQNAYMQGIKTLVNIFALSRGLTDHINNFTIKMTSPATQEDQDRDEILSNHVGMIGDIMDLLSDEAIISTKSRKEILVYYLNTLLGDPDVAKIVEDDPTSEESDITDEDGESHDYDVGDTDFDNDFSSDDNFDTDFGDTDIDTGLDDMGDLGAEDIGGEQDLGSEETPGENDFGDFTTEF